MRARTERRLERDQRDELAGIVFSRFRMQPWNTLPEHLRGPWLSVADAILAAGYRNSLPEPIHWVGDAPTSLHGNGASSFELTTRVEDEVTCRLCLTLLTRLAIERGDMATDHGELHDTNEPDESAT